MKMVGLADSTHPTVSISTTEGLVMHTGRWLSLTACGVLLLSAVAQAEKYKLEEPVDDTRVIGVGMRLDVNGKVQTQAEGNKPVDLPLTAGASLSYLERRLLGAGIDAEALRSIRSYQQAQVDIEIAEEKTTVSLADGLKLVVAQGRSSGLEFFSLGGNLSAEELELLSPPCDSLGLIGLLPKIEVEVGEEWKPAEWTGQFLARLEATTKSSVKCKLESVQDNIAKVRFTATVNGAIQGATAEITIAGTYDYDLTAKVISAADLQQTEKRAVGVVSAGLDVSARLRLLRKVALNPGPLNQPAVLEAAGQEPPSSAMLLRCETPWGMALQHTRQWHLFKQTEQVAIFRLLDQGLFVAQANLSPIPAARPGEHTSEQVFQADIKQSLGDKLKSITSAQVIPTKDKRYLYRVVVEGAIGERPLTWIYFLIAEPSGKQASLLVSLDRALVENLGNRDRELVDSIRFGPLPATAILKTPPTK